MQKEENDMHLRALIVEDSADDALLLLDHLEKTGFHVDWLRVDTEQDFVAALDQAWDIVFSDYSMPRFSGGRALKLLRQHDSNLPFVFVSGTIGEETAVAALKAGAQDYVMKGNLERLAPTVARELAEARLRRERQQTEQTLRKLSLVVEQAADSVFITDPQGRIQYVNPAFEHFTGYAAAEAIGRTPTLLKSGHHDAALYRQMWETILAGQAFRGTLINRRKDGTLFHEEKTVAPLTDDAGRITHFVSTGRDITDQVHAEEEQARLLAILEATTDFVATMDTEGKLRYLNRSGRAMLGFTDEADVNGQPAPEEWTKKWLTDAQPNLDGVWHEETTMQGADGRQVPVSQVMLSHRDAEGQVAFVSTIARDIADHKRFEQELRHQATHDALTGLPNRVLLFDHLETELARAQRGRNLAAVLFLDLDNFKRVNDSLGHAAGDALLREVATRLLTCLRPNDTVARYGGDEFTILIGDLASVENISVIVHKLRSAFERPLAIMGRELFVSFSIGISLYPNDGNEPEILLQNADTAMYRAKRRGSNQYQFYAPDMNARGQELLALETDLRRALERDEFLLYYQPQLELRSGRIVGFEALLRWQHPQHGLTPPASFVSLLEETGLIVPVGEWVLRQACAQTRALREAGLDAMRISVNVSARQFGDRALVDMVRQILREQDMRPEHLEIEITESTVMQDVQTAGDILAALDALGVRLAVDDFGTGYSSLAYLKRFPLDTLKIDRAFIQDLPGDANMAAIAEASIFLGRKLGLDVVAEGVENAGQVAFLRAHDCDLIQGYHLSRPMAADSIEDFLAQHRATWRNG